MKELGLRLELPATYQISVQGILDPRWSGRLNGMTISMKPDQPENQPITVLNGRLRDQAALFGVLTTLYNLRLPLLSVRVIE